jgi:hypothetical protein
VQPGFSANVNGTPIVIYGRTKPFEDTLETQVDLNIYALDIPRYVDYVPIPLGFKIASGTLDTRITATFTRYQSTAPTLVLAGTIGLEKFSMTQPDGRALASLVKLEIPVESATVFARDVKLGNILLQSPELYLRRERNGSLNWMSVVPNSLAAAGRRVSRARRGRRGATAEAPGRRGQARARTGAFCRRCGPEAVQDRHRGPAGGPAKVCPATDRSRVGGGSVQHQVR